MYVSCRRQPVGVGLKRLTLVLLLGSIPRETSSHLRHLLLGLLQRNHRDRMDFGQ